MRLFRLPFAALAVLLPLVAIAGCTSSSSSAPPQGSQSPSAAVTSSGASTKPELSSVAVGVLSAVNTATLYLAIKEGYFRQEGLTVIPRQLAVSTEAIPFLLHGTIAISSGNMDTYLAADAVGVLPLRILNETALCSPRTLAVLALPRSGIASAAQLAGKTIAVAADPDIQTLTINRLLGPAEAKTVRYVVVPFASMDAELAAGKIDAIATLEPYISAAERADGAKAVLDQCGGANAGMPLGGYFTTASWAAKYPNTARAFQTALNKAQALADGDPAQVRQVLPTFMKVSALVAAKVGLPRFATGLDAAAIQGVADLAYQGGELRKPVTVASLVFG
jgi:NitT/TauT family transport system substrate-binding protein